MLSLYAAAGEVHPAPADRAVARLPADVVWIDLVRPDPSEIAFIERTIGLHLPSLEEISEIESSSRLSVEDGTIHSHAVLYDGERALCEAEVDAIAGDRANLPAVSPRRPPA